MPVVAIAEALSERAPNCEVTFIGTGRERDFLKRTSFPARQMTLASPRWRGSALRLPGFVARSAGGVLAAARILRRLRPDVVVGTGGYGSVAPVVAAASLGIPRALLEQNAIPGKANRLLSRWSHEVYCHWEEALPYLHDSGNGVVLGNPVRRSILETVESPWERFGLSPYKRTLLVNGGSQGAVALNDAVGAALPLLERVSDRMQIIHSTGRLGFERACRAYEGSSIAAWVRPFIEDMGAAYHAADLVLSRAGGTSLAEITAVGVPSILVPFPYATDDHQRANALILARRRAAFLLDQDRITADLLAKLIFGLLQSRARLAEMRGRATALGNPGAAWTVAKRVIALCQAAPRRRSLARREALRPRETRAAAAG